jgi:hypothetical protein
MALCFGHGMYVTIFAVKTHPIDGSRYGPCNQTDTPREWRQP